MSTELLIEKNVLLAPLTTIQLGGPAEHFVRCRTADELVAALKSAQANQWSVHILGDGSNTIFGDGTIAGLIIQVQLEGIEVNEAGVVVAAAGEAWDNLVIQTIEHGLSGFETLSGIPGLVGATPMQNVGAYGHDVSEVITKVSAIDRRTLERVEFSNEECQFEYRGSRFKYQDADHYIITKVTYQLSPQGVPNVTYPQLIEELGGKASLTALGEGTAALQRVREAVLTLRRVKSMVIDSNDSNSRSCGSFFINPILTAEQFSDFSDRTDAVGIAPGEIPHFPAGPNQKVPAAWLIEQAGFPKGYRQGGVGVSANHNLALVNYDGTTTELLALADNIKQTVHKKFGLKLQREPVLVTAQK